MSQRTVRRSLTAVLILGALFLAAFTPAQAMGRTAPSGVHGLMERTWSWLAGLWGDEPVRSAPPARRGALTAKQGGYIDPNGTPINPNDPGQACSTPTSCTTPHP